MNGKEYYQKNKETILKRNKEYYKKNIEIVKQKAMDYYEENKKSVAKITRLDIFNLQYKLPRTWLQVPYDIANRLSRLAISKSSNQLVNSIQVNDYYLSDQPAASLDFFFTGIK
jgi:hypothetical protein